VNQAISLHIRFAADDPAAAQAAFTTILQRKGIVQEKMADTLASVRSRFGAADQKLFDELNNVTSQLATLVLNGPQRISLAEHQKLIKDLEEQREKLETEISRRSGGFFRRSETATLASVQATIPDNAALVEFAVYSPSIQKPRSIKSRMASPLCSLRSAPEGRGRVERYWRSKRD